MALPPETKPHPRMSSKKAGLNFEPLSEGLGFHPFSDGLPYAPVTKAPTTSKSVPSAKSGAGAVAAGLPDYRPPPPPLQSPRMQAPRIPVATPTATSAAPPRAPQPFSHPQMYAKPKPMVSESLTSSLSADLLQPRLGFGYVFKRLFAYLLDSAFNLSLCAAALSLALWRQDMSPELLLSPGVILVAALFLGFFNWAITTAEEVAFGTSIGKRLFGLAIHGGASAIFLRAFFFLPSAGFAGIGLLWALFDRRRRCWHDLVVDLQPIEIARL